MRDGAQSYDQVLTHSDANKVYKIVITVPFYFKLYLLYYLMWLAFSDRLWRDLFKTYTAKESFNI